MAAVNPLPTTAYSYDESGNLLTVSLPNGVTTTYTYDDLGRLVGEDVINGDDHKLFEQDYTLAADGQLNAVIASPDADHDGTRDSVATTTVHTFDIGKKNC